MIKWTLATLLLCLLVTLCRADEDHGVDELSEDEGEVHETARFAFVNLNSDGSISFTFNATSLQYTLLAALTGLVLAAILLPLLGLIGIGSSQPDYGYAYTDQQGYTGASYDVPVPSSYGSGGYGGGGTYAKRSMSWMGPIMEALSKGYRMYEARDSRSEKQEE